MIASSLKQSETISLQFPSSYGTSADEELQTQSMQWGLSNLLRSRKRQRQQTPSPTSAPTPISTSTVNVSFGLPLFRVKGFHMPTIVNYSTFLTILLFMWVSYLILPKGLRRYLCNAHRRRYRKSNPNRTIRTLGGRINPSPKIHNSKGLSFARSLSSEYSDGSSVTSTLQRGNQKFMSVKRGSPLKQDSNHFFTDSEPDWRSGRGFLSDRNKISHMHSNDSMSSSAKTYSHQHQHDHLSVERNKLIITDSSDIYSNNNTETLSSTGSAIWGTPKKFIRKRIMNEQTNDKHLNHDNATEDPIDLLSDNYNNQSSEDRHTVKNYTIEPQEKPQPALSDVESFASAFYSTNLSSSSSSTASTLQKVDESSPQNIEPSPIHPDLTCGHNVPSHMVLSSTLLSLRDPGLRLFAHGTQCEPRRIWIRLDVANEQLSWRTENNPVSSSSDPDLVTLGRIHFIPLIQILFIDVGKTTAALQLLHLHEDLCFSILTDGGSLDLQASNKVERDAFVSCMCLILDTIYSQLPPEKSWRRLNDGAGSSVGSSSCFSSSSGSDMKTHSDSTATSLSLKVNNSNYRHDHIPYVSSSSTGTGSITGSDVFHGVDLGSQVSADFREI